ncbi:MAG: TVP38/TMEM64 family protein [Clostridia bacterium]|nr:TVP38/TMEM64 family protein [Clostridia bacterium]
MKNKLIFALKIVAALLIVAALIALCIWLIPMVLSLAEPENQVRFREFIESLGVLGVLAVLLLQILQIVIAIIPGEPIEILMGVMYGTFGGLALTLVGIAIGQTLVFFAVKKLGMKFAAKFVDINKFENLSFLKDPNKRDSLIFILFFIPGTPKDILTYFAPFTGIRFTRFIILATLARIPSVVSSTWAGATISDGSFVKTLIIFAVTGVIGIGGIIINNHITKKHNNKETK